MISGDIAQHGEPDSSVSIAEPPVNGTVVCM
jgi:hypothetical protein